MWVSYSKNLVDWGRSELLMTPRLGLWDSFRIGASVPPIKTEHGWLEIYHGVKKTVAGNIYRIGTVLTDLEQPHKVIARCSEPVLSPREDYERIGDVGNVTFACGAVVENSGEIKVYYGAADTCICVATTNFNELIEVTLAGERA
jgi:beta-1,4-mannooligosaccharide/beta-1,4-mannosyl-N-acetylglucosamine phosphorylase